MTAATAAARLLIKGYVFYSERKGRLPNTSVADMIKCMVQGVVFGGAMRQPNWHLLQWQAVGISSHTSTHISAGCWAMLDQHTSAASGQGKLGKIGEYPLLDNCWADIKQIMAGQQLCTVANRYVVCKTVCKQIDASVAVIPLLGRHQSSKLTQGSRQHNSWLAVPRKDTQL